ncbi:chromate efflux transporter [Pseudotabrizicola formosa]|uniref:chromate efflux transporter n=1 Tax=Pseudotabrizicola formosa TaxID=2030009 RepID=UPI000CD18F1A|nr:chromate efflux transporter [Pseudotabrizicola formosa]
MTASLSDLARTFARIGILSFGGPAAQIALMHKVLVEERRWLTEKDYLSALSFCMLLPGPEAMQLATWAGWRLHGVKGGLIAGGLFVLPGALVVLALSMAYAAWGQLPLMQALFLGVQAAVIAIVIEALIRVARRALKGTAAYIIAIAAFLGLFVLNLPFPVIILAAGIWGLLTARGNRMAQAAPADTTAPHTAQTLCLWLAVWLLPLAGLWLHGGLLFDVGWFFSKLAVLTFGGAYAVLAWMTQDVVAVQGWLTTPQMMAGLGLAETTPGPLILVNEFVGFMAGYGAGGWGLGVAAAVVALWMTFVPCFLWIFVAAPYLSRITAAPRLAGALSAIMAAVVGVIANLSVWFALHLMFSRLTPQGFGPVQMLVPDPASLNLTALGLAIVSALLLLGLHRPLWQVLATSALLSVAISLA